MNIAFVSYHFYNHTAEGLVAAKVATGLARRGHRVTVFSSTNTFSHSGTLPFGDDDTAGMRHVQVEASEAHVPVWWKHLRQWGNRNALLDKVAAVPVLARGCTPDEWGWIQAVSNELDRLMANGETFDVLHTRLNPHVSHLVGLQVTRRHPGLPWVAYFSDPWPHHLYPAPYRFTVGPVSRYRSEHILDGMLQQADAVMVPSERLGNFLFCNGRSQFRPKMVVAPHMANVWGKGTPIPSGSTFVVRHSGFLMRERRIEPLYEGLRKLFAGHPDLRSRIRIEFAGRYDGNMRPEVPEDLREVVGFHSHMAPEDNWRWMQGAHVSLLVEAKLKEGIFFPSKLADYLGGRRPILALSPATGVVSDILRSGGGLVVEPDDVDGIARALLQLYTAWTEGRLDTYTPTAEQIYMVSQDGVIPCYEAAFEEAVERHATKQ